MIRSDFGLDPLPVRSPTGSHRIGITLIELLVALSLSVALMALIGSALHFYASTLQDRDEEIRRASVARAVMAMVSADLRATLWIQPQDMSAATALLQSANALLGGAGTGSSASGGARSGGGSSSTQSSNSSSASSSANSSSATGTETGTDEQMTTEEELLSLSVTQRPGLIGTTTSIQFDVSRLPRTDQMNFVDPYAMPTELTDVPSDIKSISYFVQAAGSIGVRAPLTSSPSDLSEGGLVRRVLDREATKYANAVGDLVRLSQTGTLVAPEVVGIEFEYWDGELWQYSWHSDDMGGLPIAIKVRLLINREQSSTPGLVATPDVYETIVRLPMATGGI